MTIKTDSTPHTVVVTGASGLLGSAIAERLRLSHNVTGLSGRSGLLNTVVCDLAAPADLDRLGDLPWDALVHCAAYRSPDYCEEHRDSATLLNARVPGLLAELAGARGARMVHISTDYVFDGTAPPYAETDKPHPVNFYGETKLQAEQNVACALPAATILRVPALYGTPPLPLTSPMLDDGIKAATATEPVEQDDAIVRVPTLTADIAAVVEFLIATPCPGILQASAAERVTRYGWACLIARLMGRDSSHISPSQNDPDRRAPRPPDVQLVTTRLRELGAPLPHDCSDVLPSILQARGVQTTGT